MTLDSVPRYILLVLLGAAFAACSEQGHQGEPRSAVTAPENASDRAARHPRSPVLPPCVSDGAVLPPGVDAASLPPCFLEAPASELGALPSAPPLMETSDSAIIPRHRHAAVEIHAGRALGLLVDGASITGLSWGSACPGRATEAEIVAMVGSSGLKATRIAVALGDDLLQVCGGPGVWDGRQGFDWSLLDRELDRYLRAQPKTRFTLQVMLHGSLRWVQDHPSDAAVGASAAPGTPDFFSDSWRADAGMALTRLVRHVRDVPAYRDAVIGFQLLPGAALADGTELSPGSRGFRRDFRDFLRRRYADDVGRLQSAWGRTDLTFDSAEPAPRPTTSRMNRLAQLLVPAWYRAETDTFDFLVASRERAASDFAETVRAAGDGEVLAGVSLTEPLAHTMSFYRNPALAFYEAPAASEGSARALASDGLRALGKLPFEMIGADLHVTPAMRRGFVEALLKARLPTLWGATPQSAGAGSQSRVPLSRLEEIASRSRAMQRASVAELAIVVDPALGRYLGDGSKLPFEAPMKAWERVGAPYDQIFLDQIETAGPYKVYVFFHTMAHSSEEVGRIHEVLRRNEATGVFVYADGMIDGHGNADGRDLGRNISDLTGMRVVGSLAPRNVRLRAAERSIEDSPAETEELAPSFSVLPDPVRGEKILATYEDGGEAAIVERAMPDGRRIIYSATPYLSPGLFRYALRVSGAHLYSGIDDQIAVDASFASVFSTSTRTVVLEFPEPTPLCEVFGEVESAVASRHELEVDADTAYLFFRGPCAKWQRAREDR